MSDQAKDANEPTNETLKDVGKHLFHGVEDVADVVGHGAAGAVEGIADGVKSASDATKLRDLKSD